MNSNSENPKVGRVFQELVAKLLTSYFNETFYNDIVIPIGEPAKNHKFDCVSEEQSIIAECKCYTWTETGNIPSAKMGFINEAVFYMSYLSKDTIKIVVMKKATHPRRNETLAEYYCRTNMHLLKGIKVFELDLEKEFLKVIKG
jgi:hypothetical protein